MGFKEEMRAARAIGNGDFDAAIGTYKETLAKDERDTLALNMIAQCYEWKGDLDNAIQYANKTLDIEPNDFHMLMLAARYWHKMNDEERTYHYVCRVIENPPEPFPGFPKWIFWIVKPFSLVFKGLRKLEEKSINDFAENEKTDVKSLEWAKHYKAWYESKHGKQGDNGSVKN